MAKPLVKRVFIPPLIRGLFVLASLLLATPTRAQLPTTRLASIFPPGLSPGTTNEIVVTGEFLDDSAGMLFSDPRLTATPKPGAVNTYIVTVPGDLKPGTVDLRIGGRFGASNPRALAIGDGPELITSGSNTSLSNALDIPLNKVINGKVAAATDHWFHFSAKAGQPLIARVEAASLDSRLEPVLAFYSSDQRELGHSRRGLLELVPPTDGHYVLQLHDGTYKGGDEYTYRLSLSTGPHLEFAVPPALQIGATNHGFLFGRNLPGSQRSAVRGIEGGTLEQLEVEIPVTADAAPEEFLPRFGGYTWKSTSWRFTSINGLSDPLALGLTRGRVTGVATSAVVSVTLPCEQGGLFPHRKEHSGVRFEAKKGESWRVELLSDRLGFRTAAGMMLQRLKKSETGTETYTDVEEIRDAEKRFEDRDFNTVSRDISASLKIPEDGTYRLLVRDYYHSAEEGPQYPYLLRVVPDAPDFHLAVVLAIPPKSQDNDRRYHVLNPVLRPGETVALRVYVTRQNLDSDIEVLATNLPPGISSTPVRIASGQNKGTLLLTAAENATNVVGPLQILGRAQEDKVDLTRTARAASVLWPVGDYDEEPVTSRWVRQPILSIAGTELAPITIAAESTSPLEVQAGTRVKVPLRIKKRLDFTGKFKLKPTGETALEKSKELEIDPGSTNAVAEIDLGETALGEGLHTLWLQGAATVKYRSFLDSLAVAEADLNSATQAAKDAKPDDKKNAEERLKAAQERKKAADERAKARDIPLMIYTEPFVLKVIPAPKAPAKS